MTFGSWNHFIPRKDNTYVQNWKFRSGSAAVYIGPKVVNNIPSLWCLCVCFYSKRIFHTEIGNIWIFSTYFEIYLRLSIKFVKGLPGLQGLIGQSGERGEKGSIGKQFQLNYTNNAIEQLNTEFMSVCFMRFLFKVSKEKLDYAANQDRSVRLVQKVIMVSQGLKDIKVLLWLKYF